METRILKVTGQGDPMMVPSKKQEGGQLAKCYIRLKELGGDYADEYLAVMFGCGGVGSGCESGVPHARKQRGVLPGRYRKGRCTAELDHGFYGLNGF